MPSPRAPSSLRLNIPDGSLGTRETLKHMRQLVQQGKLNPSNRYLANRITGAVPAKDWHGELVAIFEWVRGNIRYALDPHDVETIQAAATTARLGYGDCDDISILLATLCECAGHPCCFIAVGFGAVGEFNHVLVMASGAGESAWLFMDATEPSPCGWFPEGATCELICPITSAAEEMVRGR